MFRLTILPQEYEKKRFWIVIIVFVFVLIGAGIYGWLMFYPKTTKTTTATTLPKPTKTDNQEISAEIKQFGIKIEKINVLAPIIKNVDGNNKTIYNKALQKGLAHYKGTSLPTEGGNIFIFGHSSSTLGTGPYATIFAKLNELKKNDVIIIYYQDKEYQYTVFKKVILEANDTSVLDPTKREQLTLMTCWPIGTNQKRLIIKAYPLDTGQ
ncbi:MAG: sortase [Candidatus Berkelbacteria bacterium]|nr:sortase [Candidatus Berkelbacteria bacterium]